MHSQKKDSLIDTHAHLTFPDYKDDRSDTLARAWEAGIKAVVVIGAGSGLEGNRAAVTFAEENENVYAAVGIHPHDAKNVDPKKAAKEIIKLSESKKVVAVGEIGLDYFRQRSSDTAQKRCFRTFLDVASELNLPVSIHDREAHADVLGILRESKYQAAGGVLHCFSGDVDMAKEVIGFGFYIAIPGIITFKKAENLTGVVKEIPVENLVLETDCPFLAPEPFRGKRNEPAYVAYIAEKIAKIKGLSVSDVARITTVNAQRLFNLPGAKSAGKIAYPIRRSLYINITNRCTLGCTFCPKRSGSFEVKGYNLRLEHEPNVEDIFRAIGDLKGFEEVVFCGFGEPTMRLELMKVIAKQLKGKGMRVRLDTDGLANLIHGRDIVPELAGIIDSVSVSMNAPDPETYVKLCPSSFGEDAFHAMLAFLGRAKGHIREVTATVVDVPGLDIEKCEKLARDIGIPLRIRKFQEVG